MLLFVYVDVGPGADVRAPAAAAPVLLFHLLSIVTLRFSFYCFDMTLAVVVVVDDSVAVVIVDDFVCVFIAVFGFLPKAL